MICVISIGQPRRIQRGMTLIELLVVAALLAAVSFIAYTNFGGIVTDSKEQIAHAEMQEIAKAIRQFKQDTGYYPKQGPFGLLPAGGVDPDEFPTQITANKEAWFYSPANFWQLFDCPDVTNQWPSWLGCADDERQSWDPVRGRGWRGPYLQRGDGYVDVSDALDTAGSGDPIDDDLAHKRLRVYGVADPFSQLEPTPVNASFDPDPGDEWLLDWRSKYDADPDDDAYLGSIGGPYFLFDLDDLALARLVSMGPDGVYDGYSTDPCEPNGDDLVVCLE